ncbi:hypothetical protein BDV06DRAFT_228788 [Aspergillus oleicola]
MSNTPAKQPDNVESSSHQASPSVTQPVSLSNPGNNVASERYLDWETDDRTSERSCTVGFDTNTAHETPRLRQQLDIRQQEPPQELVQGVDLQDYPIIRTGCSADMVEHYQKKSPCRPLDWKIKDGEIKREPLITMGQVEAAFAQTRGEPAKEPCARCWSGKGTWETCVIQDQIEGRNPTKKDKVCANCRFYKLWQCSLDLAENTDSDDELNQQDEFRYLRTNSTGNCETIAGRSTRKGQKTSDALTHGDGSAPHRASPAIPSNPAKRGPGRPPKRKAPELPVAKLTESTQNHPDPEIVEFPLSDDSLHDLSLLQRTCDKYEIYIQAIEARGAQLELMQMQQRAKDPWTFSSPALASYPGFPLGRDQYFDLAQIRQASVEMKGHHQKMMKRVSQIEEVDKDGWKGL